ncbi:hypothetical protein AVEN_216366-1 [Araneus ventricosus]|uniref:Uncharacterized protein n=1 Tax=Araneus ventricosus TaxID=182803 RepID=A0A4Y2H7Z3_ARAVE|nr:hypothetical protein AVEN_216366-1 [Araneus ventricosus]
MLNLFSKCLQNQEKGQFQFVGTVLKSSSVDSLVFDVRTFTNISPERSSRPNALTAKEIFAFSRRDVSHSGVIPALPWHPDSSEERSPRQQSETEVGVVIANTGHCLTPPEGSTSSHRSGCFLNPTKLLCTPGKRKPAYLSGGFLLSTISSCPPPDG